MSLEILSLLITKYSFFSLLKILACSLRIGLELGVGLELLYPTLFVRAVLCGCKLMSKWASKHMRCSELHIH